MENEGAGGSGRARVQPEKKEFWDSFGDAGGGGGGGGGSSIGTAAMRKGGGGGGGGGKDEGWGDW